MHKKIITFSLWGDNPKYCVGAVKNAKLREKIYPDWICRFYVHNKVPQKYIEQLKNIDKTEVVIENRSADWTGMFWRFEAIADSDVKIMISRDCDSRLNEREMHAVHEFENGEHSFHIMRDHPHHGFNVLGGMFGIKKNLSKLMHEMCNKFNKTNSYGTDYQFFDSFIRQIPPNTILTHDPFFAKKDFPQPRLSYEFVGEVFDEHDNNNINHTNSLIYSIT